MPFKTEIRWSSYKKVPQCVVDGKHVTDSPEIFRQLFPRLSGREISPAEAAIERNVITYGLMPALQIMMFQDRTSISRFMALATRDMGPVLNAAATLGAFIAGPALPLAARTRRAYPGLQDAGVYCAELARLLGPAAGGGPYLLGAQTPGALDISLWGTLEPFARARCPVFPGPLASAGLCGWHSRMAAVMAGRRPVF